LNQNFKNKQEKLDILSAFTKKIQYKTYHSRVANMWNDKKLENACSTDVRTDARTTNTEMYIVQPYFAISNLVFSLYWFKVQFSTSISARKKYRFTSNMFYYTVWMQSRMWFKEKCVAKFEVKECVLVTICANTIRYDLNA